MGVGEFLQRGDQTAFGQGGRVDAVDEVAQLLKGGPGVPVRLLDQGARQCGVVVEPMEEALRRQVELTVPDETRTFIDWDHRFHSALVTSSHNDMLIKFYDGLRARQVRAGIVPLLSTQDRYTSVLDEHALILEALRSGDEERARAAIDSHLDATLRVLLEA